MDPRKTVPRIFCSAGLSAKVRNKLTFSNNQKFRVSVDRSNNYGIFLHLVLRQWLSQESDIYMLDSVFALIFSPFAYRYCSLLFSTLPLLTFPFSLPSGRGLYMAEVPSPKGEYQPTICHFGVGIFKKGRKRGKNVKGNERKGKEK